MALNLVLGCNREMFMAALGASAPTWSFLEDQVGTTITSAPMGREVRLGEPIGTGPNSAWHQLTWQGGAQQDIWQDNQMYQKGNVDVSTWAGKAKMWPGLQSWWKKDNLPNARGMAMWQGSRSNIDNVNLTALTCGERDLKPSENVAAVYELFQLNPGYARGDPRAIQHVATSLTGPWRVVQPAMADDYSSGITMCMTQTQMFLLYENVVKGNVNDNKLIQDTNAPLTTTSGFQYHNDTACSYVDGFYYGHGNRLYKRIPKAPYGVLGTHTMIHAIKAAQYLQGMVVWNNRIYFGAVYPNGQYSVFVSDGATTIKAFDFPSQFIPGQMAVVAGGLYIIGYQPSGVGTPPTVGRPNTVQQVWRFDGVSLKKLWQEGHFEDGNQHTQTGIIEYNGMACWGSNGTNSSGNQTGVYKENYACLMFYDPINDAIVPGPGLGAQNSTGHLWITGLARWNNTVAVYFRDDSGVGSGMIATLRQEDLTRNDFRWPVNGSNAQFQDPAGSNRFLELFTSEYHGPDDIINDRKTWLAVRTRTKFTGSSNNANLQIYYRTGIDSLTDTLLGTITPAGTGDWQDNVTLIKNVAGTSYLQSKKIQLRLVFNNTDLNQPDSTAQVWLDDVSVTWFPAPVKQRQWQIRIPISEAQLTLHSGNTPNSLTTAAAMKAQLESLYFAQEPFLFWEPLADGSLPANTANAIEVRISSYQCHWSRLELNNSASVPSDQYGTVSLTLVENEPSL